MKLSKRIALIFASLLMVLCVSVSVSAKESPTKQSFKASLKQSAVVYDGKTHKPSVVVKDLNGKTLNKKYYTVQAKKVKICRIRSKAYLQDQTEETESICIQVEYYSKVQQK